MKLNKKQIFSAVFTLSIIATAGVYFYQKKSISQQAAHLEVEKTLHQKLIEEFSRANLAKFEFIESILKKSLGTEGIKYDLQQLKAIHLNSQDDFDRYEMLYSRVNQGLGIESIKILDNKGNLFKNEAQLRKLEQYDLAIDLTRKRLSEFTFNWNLKKSMNDKKWLSKQSSQQLPIFKVDALILSKDRSQN